MKQLAVHLARGVFRRLPLSHQQRKALIFTLFRLTKDRFKHLPSYRLYEREALWLAAPVPQDLPANRKMIMQQHYAHEHGRAMLMISHVLGGGTQQHVDDMAQRLEAEGWRVFYLQRHNQHHLRLLPASPDRARPLFFHWPQELAALVETLKQLGISHLHLHHTVDLPEDFPSHFQGLATSLGLLYDFTLHDYFSICPRFTLYDDAVRSYCGEPEDVRKCTACVSRFGSHIGNDIDVAQWRQQYGALLMGARKVFVPDRDISNRLQRYLPLREFSVLPHPEVQHFTRLAVERKSGEPLRIVTVGGIAPHKGSHVIFDCAQDALRRNLPLEFHLVGYSDIDHKFKSLRNVTVTGHFKLEDLPRLLEQGKYHIAYLPAVWPETYNYVLSECWRHGFYTVGLDIGAIASRIHAAPELGTVLPLEWYLKPAKLNDALLALNIPALTQEHVFSALRDYPSLTRDYYGL